MDIDYNTLTDFAGLDGHEPLFGQGTEPLYDSPYFGYCEYFYPISYEPRETDQLVRFTPSWNEPSYGCKTIF